MTRGPACPSYTTNNRMPPKKGESATAAAVDIAGQLDELKTIINGYKERFDKLDRLIEEMKKENKELKKQHKEMKQTLEERDAEIFSLRDRLNDQEQYIRGWSVRVLHVDIPEEEATDPYKVMKQVHSRVFLPILQGARDRKLIHTIPSAEELLETAHILPSKPGTVPPIICRFFTRNLRTLMFRLKRDCAPRETPEEPAGTRSERSKPGRYLNPFYEDLTRPNFNKFRALSQHDSVQSCWTVNGSIRYKLKGDETIRKVKSVYASVEDILAIK